MTSETVKAVLTSCTVTDLRTEIERRRRELTRCAAALDRLDQARQQHRSSRRHTSHITRQDVRRKLFELLKRPGDSIVVRERFRGTYRARLAREVAEESVEFEFQPSHGREPAKVVRLEPPAPVRVRRSRPERAAPPIEPTEHDEQILARLLRELPNVGSEIPFLAHVFKSQGFRDRAFAIVQRDVRFEPSNDGLGVRRVRMTNDQEASCG